MRIVKKLLLYLAITLITLTAFIYLFMQQKTFGKNPSGVRLERIKKSPNYKDGSFQNLTPTEITLKSASFIKMMGDFLTKPKTTTPAKPIPAIHTNLNILPSDKPVIIWFGHSSYFIKSKDISILVDPVLSGNAGPVSFFGKAFEGTDIYKAADFPPLDMVIITHDHYDHLDYKTITELIPKTKVFYTSLGVGAHLEHWGIAQEKIIELDWWEHKKISEQIEITATPARHFSGRGIQRNKTLWSSFVLKLHNYKFMVGGDSGYENHFKTIGEKYGPLDLAILEAGQYGKDWPYIHMLPEQTVQAAIDLKAKVLFPVHWSKFALAYHAWNEPIERVIKFAAENNVQVTTPKIGEPIVIDSLYSQKVWWNF